MKQKYSFIGLIAFLFSFQLFSQSCPEISFVVPLPTEEIVFIYNDPGPDCGDRPAAIVIDGSAYSLGNCDTYSSRYVLASGSGVIDPDNFSVTYGALTCEYNEGTLLGLDDAKSILERTVKVYPNPVHNINELQVSLTVPLVGKLTVFDLNGKKILSEKINNESVKKMNISNLENGLYLLQIDTGTIKISKKFIVDK